MTHGSKWNRLIAVVALLAGIWVPIMAADAEEELKSAIVLSFLRYSTWPSVASSDGMLTVAVLGRQSLLDVLRRLLDGKTVSNRTIRIVEMKTAAEPCRCQVLYLGSSNKRAEIKQALTAARAARVLTIGETDHFLESGGAVNLLILDGHMSFEVNLEAVGESGVEISSKLLRLGQILKGRRS